MLIIKLYRRRIVVRIDECMLSRSFVPQDDKSIRLSNKDELLYTAQ
jgi:hypothetical protein